MSSFNRLFLIKLRRPACPLAIHVHAFPSDRDVLLAIDESDYLAVARGRKLWASRLSLQHWHQGILAIDWRFYFDFWSVRDSDRWLKHSLLCTGPVLACDYLTAVQDQEVMDEVFVIFTKHLVVWIKVLWDNQVILACTPVVVNHVAFSQEIWDKSLYSSIGGCFDKEQLFHRVPKVSVES